MNVLALCAGVGGLELGIRLAVPTARTVCYVERDAFAATVLVARMEDGILDDAPIWDDVGTFDGKPWRGVVDCITGGYPCQPFSSAGKRRGTDDPRHLWPSFARIIREVQPQLCFFENVDAHLTLGYDAVRGELQELGYRVTEGLYTAAEVGAPHLRRRLFILAHAEVLRGVEVERGKSNGAAEGSGGVAESNSGGCEKSRLQVRPGRSQQAEGVTGRAGEASAHARCEGRRQESRSTHGDEASNAGRSQENDHEPSGYGPRRDMADAQHGRRDGGGRRLGQGRGGESEIGGAPNPDIERLEGWGRQAQPQSRQAVDGDGYWSTEPDVGRVAHGVAARVDRLRACGNGVVPAVAARAWRELSSLAE